MNLFSFSSFLITRCLPADFHELLSDSFWNAVRRRLLRYYRDSSDPEIRSILDFLRMHNANSFNLPFTLEYLNRPVEVHTDISSGLLYVEEANGPLYFRRDMTVRQAVSCYNSICMEQDDRSPHAYLPPPFHMPSEGALLDIGCAEALFALRHIHEVPAAYLFESNPGWHEALCHTFAPYEGKVHVVCKYVAGKTDANSITLDDFASSISFPIGFVKMDIEGMEEQALSGASRLLASGRNCHWAVCTYHHAGAERAIRSFFEHGYHLESTTGYMLFLSTLAAFGFARPELRKCVLHATRNG